MAFHENLDMSAVAAGFSLRKMNEVTQSKDCGYGKHFNETLSW